MRDKPTSAAMSHSQRNERLRGASMAKYKLVTTAKAVKVCPEGIETNSSFSPAICIKVLSISAAGRGLTIKPLPSRANTMANGAAHSQAHINRGCRTNKGEVIANTAQPFPKAEIPVQTAIGTTAQAWLIAKNSAGSHQCSHSGTLIKITKKGTAHIHRCVGLSEVNKELKDDPPK
jgi:hypothetical protein